MIKKICKRGLINKRKYRQCNRPKNSDKTKYSFKQEFHRISDLYQYTQNSFFSKTSTLQKHTSDSTCGHFMVIKLWQKSLIHLDDNFRDIWCWQDSSYCLSWTSLEIQLGKLTPWKGTIPVAALTIAVDFINGSKYSKVTDLCLGCHCALTLIADVWEVPQYTENRKLKKSRDKFYFFFSLIFPSLLYLSNPQFSTLAALASLWQHSAISSWVLLHTFPKTHLPATLATALFFSSYLSSESNLWC